MSTDLGDLAALATALGLLDADGDLVPDWFTRPGDHLAAVLRNAHQREALVAFVDDVLGGEEATTDAAGRRWLPVVTVRDGTFSAYAVLGAEAERVVVGAGVRVAFTSESGVRCHVSGSVPLFAQPVAGGEVTAVPGTPGAHVDVALDLGLPTGTETAGVALAGIRLDVAVPTWPEGQPRFALVLRGLRLPGTTAATDVAVRAESVAELDDTLLELVLALVRAQSEGLPAGTPLRGLAGLLGLTSDAVPDFPLDAVLARGIGAVTEWFAGVVADDTVRAAWLGGLADLVGGTVQGAATDAHVVVDLAPATLRLRVSTAAGAAGRPVVVPTVTLDVAGADGVTLALDVDPVSLDLGSGAAVAVPRLSLTARVTGVGGAPLLAPTGSGVARVGVTELRGGFGLDATRRPVLLVEAREADVGATHFDVLDLTSPDALAGAAEQVLVDAAGSLLDGFGSAGEAVAAVVGLPRPGSTAPVADPARLLTDPLGAVADRWRALLAGPAEEVRAVLAALRDLVAESGVHAVSVSGAGTPVDPWRVPLATGTALTVGHRDGVLAVGVAADVTTGSLGGSGISAGVVVGATLVELALGADGVPRGAAFLPAADARLRFTAADGGALVVGSAPTTLEAGELGLGVGWRPGSSTTVQPVLTGARLRLGGGGTIDLPVPVLAADGTLALDPEGWVALETLAGAAAEALAARGEVPWLADAVRLLGWSPSDGGGGRGRSSSAPRLSLAMLLTDPGPALADHLRALLDVSDDAAGVRSVLDLVSRLLGPAVGRYGGGSDRDPWRLPLIGTALEGAADAVPALLAWLGPNGPQDAVSPRVAPLFGWQPGDPPLATATLVAALAGQAVHDDVLADLMAGRADVVAGLEELVVRWTGTDGLVGLTQDDLPGGVTPHRLSDVVHTAPLAALDLTGVVGGAVPATVVYVALDPAVLPDVPADHRVDLTGAGLPPQAFAPTLPADPRGPWSVRLGTRSACRSDTAGDPDGVRGQAERLARLLGPLAGAGPVLVVAHAGAGHPAVRAASTVATAGGAVTAVVTVGTPWTTLTVDTLDRLPGADTLALLAGLLPAAPSDPDAEPEDDDITTARRVLGVWQAMSAQGDPLAELRPPSSPTPLGAVTVHACVGSLGEASVRRALTATVVTALVERAWARSEVPPGLPEVTRAGLRWPLLAPTTRAGLVTSLRVDLDLGGTGDRAAGDTGPSVVVRLALGGDGGWLLGGPDPGRSATGERPLALRRLTARLDLPVGAAPARARVDLHDATALGVHRTRWTLAAGPAAPTGATPVLPEVRALLAGVTGRVTAAAAGDPVVGGLLDTLRAVGLVGADGGFDTVTLDRVLLDTAGVAATVRGDAARRAALASGLRALTGDARPAATAGDGVRWTRAGDGVEAVVTTDLGTGALGVEVAGTGAVPWAVTGGLAAGVPRLAVRLGADGSALAVDLTAPSATVEVARPSGSRTVPLWPAPDGIAIGRALADVAPAVVTRTLLDVLREALGDAASTAGAALDTLLDGLGLLDAGRRLRVPVGLVTDPGGWLRSLPAAAGPGGLGASVPALLDAVRGLLGVPGGPGRLEITPGVAVTAVADAGVLRLGVGLDGSAFAGAGDAGRLVVSGRVGLAVGAGGTTSPGVLPDVELGGRLDGVGGVRLRAGAGRGAAGPTAVGVELALLPDGGVAIPLLPGGPGLGGAVGAAAASAAVKALPRLLDAVADLDPTGDPTTPPELAGRLVTRLGDALALRTGAPTSRRFDEHALSAFGRDPAGALAARAAALAVVGLDPLVEAVAPLLGPATTRSVSATEGALVVRLAGVEVRWTPGTHRVGATFTTSGLPGVGSVTAGLDAGPAGLLSLDVMVGPAELDAGVFVLRPFARVRAGQAPVGGPAVEIGLATGSGSLLVARWAPGPTPFALVARTPGATPVDSTAPEPVVLAVVEAVVDLAGAFVLAVPAVTAALDHPVLGTTARTLLAGVLLDPADTGRLAGDLLEPDRLLPRIGLLGLNLAGAPGAEVTVEDALTLAPHADDVGGGVTALGLTVGLARPFALGGGDVTATLEQLSSWITAPTGAVPGGLTLTVLTVDGDGTVGFRPGIVVGGLGLRLARTSGPLLDAVVTIEEVALHVFADVGLGGDGGVDVSGGARLELGGLSVGLAGATGGTNAVATGLLGSGSESPRPRFSPALAVQRHGAGPVTVSLSAGDGAGPWWVVVQKGFGPIYVEQVGLAVTMAQDTLGSVGLLVDGQVSLLGLTATVDDLSLTYLVSAGSPLSGQSWAVDLAGLAITADLSGISLAGGLRKFPVAGGGSEYLGLLMARVAVYGISVYGGYGLVGPDDDRYASLFLFGAVNGPIGGPPAFFVTGIGGGFGINRALRYPADLGQFGTFPFIKALDPAARPGDPMRELQAVRDAFPPERGSFWFAAGLSFTSFALVDGVAVVAVRIGDGLEVALLGLARMALPRPEAALVSVELGLLARVSTREGVVLVQAQLTDNSWLLFPTIRLTGGFAFASWFGGPNKGQFVLTLGGYHPSFHRDGYPVVPRLGIAVDLYGFISITGQSYFALTSEAVMAGTRMEISARFGPAWAALELGADGIVLFDPFWFEVTVYASISAGITIDVWIGEITISVSLRARVVVTGPPLHGRATFSVGPAELEVEFGDRGSAPQAIDWPTFTRKYLEDAGDGRAHVLTTVPGKGAVPPAGSADTGGARSPDGSDANPFRVVPEFGLTLTSTAPLRELAVAGSIKDLPTVPEVSAAPMRRPARPRVTVTFVGPAHASPQDRADRLTLQALEHGAFALGTWGPAQDLDDKKVPAGDVLSAVDRVLVRTTVVIAGGTGPIEYRQVEVDPYRRRRPLPFVTEGAAERLAGLTEASALLVGTVPALAGRTTTQAAADLLAGRGGRSPADVAAWVGSRAAPPLLGALGEGLGRAARTAVVTAQAPAPRPEPAPLRPPVVAAVLAAAVPDVVAAQLPVDAHGRAGEALAVGSRTTVGPRILEQAGDVVRSAPPRLTDADAVLDPAVPATLLRVAPAAAVVGGTVLASRAAAATRSGRSGVETVAGRAADPAAADRLRGLSARLHQALPIAAGEVHVLDLPDADRDVDPASRPHLMVHDGAVRVTAVGPGAGVLADAVLHPGDAVAVPPGTRRVALTGLGTPHPGTDHRAPTDVLGWSSDTPLPYVGGEVLLGRDAVVASSGRVPLRHGSAVRTGWVAADAVVTGATAVVTTFARPVDVVAVALEGGVGDDMALGIDGAGRATDADGRPEPPTIVADGPRAVALFRVRPRRGRRPVVTVASSAQRHLVGVAGAVGVTPEALASAIADRGFPSVVPPPLPVAAGSALVSWQEPS